MAQMVLKCTQMHILKTLPKFSLLKTLAAFCFTFLKSNFAERLSTSCATLWVILGLCCASCVSQSVNVAVWGLFQFRRISLAANMKPVNDILISALVRLGGTNDLSPNKHSCGDSWPLEPPF